MLNKLLHAKVSEISNCIENKTQLVIPKEVSAMAVYSAVGKNNFGKIGFLVICISL